MKSNIHLHVTNQVNTSFDFFFYIGLKIDQEFPKCLDLLSSFLLSNEFSCFSMGFQYKDLVTLKVQYSLSPSGMYDIWRKVVLEQVGIDLI